MHLDELLSFRREFHRTYGQGWGNLRGSDRYPVNEPRLSEERGTSIFRVMTQVNTSRKTKQGKRRFKRVGIHSLPVSGERGSGNIRHKH